MAMSDARRSSTVIVTGGCGFVGSHFTRHTLRVCPHWAVIHLDKQTYAGDRTNLADVAKVQGDQVVCGARGMDRSRNASPAHEAPPQSGSQKRLRRV